ncbi:PREDICTED: uncharacterized protein LOC108558739 [Nicrophorus vespilloides]|uniref:Uncharacterized protein LOC108558739 n=1 Tax=Nicrophorus vespilloides TaxID=110193 RepID=A0ABM1M9J1_NICVS|nr:PREDICTED: uncharacterized protein LOC108558739 [Nicrophorus vespilloides]
MEQKETGENTTHVMSFSEPVILDQESDHSTLHLVFSEDSEDEFKRKKGKRSKSWHNSLQKPEGSKLKDDDDGKVCHELCSCRAEDFQQVMSRSAAVCATKSEINPRACDSLRNQLEIMVSNAVSSELDHSDVNRPLHANFAKLETVLETLVQYLDCLDLEMRASYRLCNNIDDFLATNAKSSTFSTLLKNLSTTPRNSGYATTRKTITSCLCGAKKLDDLVADYKDKKADFNKAIHNFRMILDSNFSAAQLKKLKKQFDLILVKFQHSRYVLDSALPVAIRERTSVLLNCCQILGEELQKVANDRSDLALLFQHLETILHPPISQNT